MPEALDLSHTDVEIGILIFDIEHRAMLDKLHIFYDGVASGQPKHDMLQTLANLLDVASQHFDHEEDYMKNFRYGGLQKHSEDHRALFSYLERLGDELFSQSASAARNLGKVRSFFRALLINHFLEHDRTLANFLTQNGIR